MNVDAFNIFKKYCGYHDIVCKGSMYDDILSYHSIEINNKQATSIVNDVNSYMKTLWDMSGNKIDNKDDSKKISMIRFENGIYKNVLKLDFTKAFSNYCEFVMPCKLHRIFIDMTDKVSKMNIPSSCKKFLYNYTLTNLLIRDIGTKGLSELRSMVYENIMVKASNYGTPIKSEVDGCYILCNKDDDNDVVLDSIYGRITSKKFKLFVLLNNIFIGVRNNDVMIKGLDKNLPNIYSKTIKEFMKTLQDNVLDDFLFRNIDILDWCCKTNSGETVKLYLNDSKIEVPSITESDILEIKEFTPQLSRDRYYYDVSKYIEQIMMLDIRLLGYAKRRHRK